MGNNDFYFSSIGLIVWVDIIASRLPNSAGEGHERFEHKFHLYIIYVVVAVLLTVVGVLCIFLLFINAAYKVGVYKQKWDFCNCTLWCSSFKLFGDLNHNLEWYLFKPDLWQTIVLQAQMPDGSHLIDKVHQPSTILW